MNLDDYLPGIVAGDEDSFARWMAGAERPIRESLRRFAASVDTEAAVQETLLRIWLVARRCRPDGQPNSLLRFAIGIARNLALSEIRRRRREELVPDAPEPPGLAAEPSLPDPALREIIRRCLEKLPRKPAAALRARIESAGTQPDSRLADGLGMRLNTLLQNITRARRLVAQCLQQAGFEVR
jgi:RNA polymerase sigma factor (sigma-70 family)